MSVFDWWVVALVLALVLVMLVPYQVEGAYVNPSRNHDRHPSAPVVMRVRLSIGVVVLLVWTLLTCFAQAMDEQNARLTQHTQVHK